MALILSAAAESAVTIPITVSSQSTAGAEDYSGVPEAVTFAHGETFAYFTVLPTPDSEDEGDEQVLLGFGPLPEGVGEGNPSRATVTLKDSLRVSFTASSYTATEGGEDAQVTVRLHDPAPFRVTVPLKAEGGNGATEDDWTGVPAAVTFDTGEESKTFTVSAVDDTVEDDGEMVEIGFGNLPNEFIPAAPAVATVILMNSEEGRNEPVTCETPGDIWCATMTLEKRTRPPGFEDHAPSFEGTNLSDTDFVYKGKEFPNIWIDVAPDFHFPGIPISP